MKILQTNRFKKTYKKLHGNQLEEVNLAIDAVSENPLIGVQKRGDLSWLRVHKFSCVGRLMLLGYHIDEADDIVLTLVDVGNHENFYRDCQEKMKMSW